MDLLVRPSSTVICKGTSRISPMFASFTGTGPLASGVNWTGWTGALATGCAYCGGA